MCCSQGWKRCCCPMAVGDSETEDYYCMLPPCVCWLCCRGEHSYAPVASFSVFAQSLRYRRHAGLLRDTGFVEAVEDNVATTTLMKWPLLAGVVLVVIGVAAKWTLDAEVLGTSILKGHESDFDFGLWAVILIVAGAFSHLPSRH